jgi:hypothetical protein
VTDAEPGYALQQLNAYFRRHARILTEVGEGRPGRVRRACTWMSQERLEIELELAPVTAQHDD